MAGIPYQSANRLSDTINIWVYVDKTDEGSQCMAAPFWVPKGTWNLVWDLVTLHLHQGAEPAKFANQGIGLDMDGDPLVILDQRRTSDTQYWIAVKNEGAKQTLVGYKIFLGTGPIQAILDPTIIVATDPIDPPPGWLGARR